MRRSLRPRRRRGTALPERGNDAEQRRRVALLRRLHAAQNRFYAGGDAAPLRDILAEDIAWHVSGRNAIAGDYHGVEAVLAYFRRHRELADRSFRMHTRDVLILAPDDRSADSASPVTR
ncbi:MAG: hypothetical protein ACJ72W_04460 [Actinoallomurus sp.]